MTVFVDSSALYAVLDADDDNHPPAATEWARLLDGATTLRTHSYVIVEAAALVQHRLGMDAATALHRDVVPALSVRFVDRALHQAATIALLAAGRRSISLVDWTSFEVMRDEQVGDAFAFDTDFTDQGFRVLPAVRGRRRRR
ncbi:MAG: type II toxin-antitoxin system VapC family toxin [Acidimicrobiia bacterium]